jgi:O-antigen ligase
MIPSAIQAKNISTPNPFRLSPIIWGSLIILQGITFCLEPIWSGVVLIMAILAVIFVATAVINPQWTLLMILAITLLLPMRFMMLSITNYVLTEPAMVWIICLIFIIITTAIIRGKPILSATPLDRWLVALVILAVLNCLISKNPGLCVNTWLRFLISGPGIFLLVFHYFADPISIRKAFTFIFIIITFTVLYLMLEHFLKYNPIFHNFYITRNRFYTPGTPIYRVIGFGGTPLITGSVLSLTLPFFLFKVLYSSNTTKRLLWGAITLTLIMVAISTYSRGTIIAIIMIIVLIAVRSVKTLVIFIVTLTGLISILYVTNGLDFIMFRFSPKFLLSDFSMWHRLLMYWTCWHIFSDYPILGAGLNSMWKLYPLYRHPLDFLNIAVVDNQFLTFLYGTGIIGAIIIFGMLVKIPYFILKKVKVNQLPKIKNFLKFAAIAFIGGYVNSLTCDIMDWIYFNLLFWFLTALLFKLASFSEAQIKTFFEPNNMKNSPTPTQR